MVYGAKCKKNQNAIFSKEDRPFTFFLFIILIEFTFTFFLFIILIELDDTYKYLGVHLFKNNRGTELRK